MENSVSLSKCNSCLKPKAVFICGACQNPICKLCTEFLEPNSFPYKRELPAELKFEHFCQACYTVKVLPAKRQYNEILSLAKKVTIVDKPQRRPLQIIRNSKEVLHVENCLDEEDVYMRLAFLAAEKGHNAVIKVKLVYTKIRNAGYQKMDWSGTGTPATLGNRSI